MIAILNYVRQLPVTGDYTYLLVYLISLAFFILIWMFLGQRYQLYLWLREAEKATFRLEAMAKKSREVLINAIKEVGKVNKDPSEEVDKFMDFFVIEPVDRDPFGVLKRLEHILDVEREKFKDVVAKVAPNAGGEEKANLEVSFAATWAVNYIYKFVRHYTLLGKKTKSMLVIMQIVYNLPLIMRLAEAYFNSLDPFTKGKPIGDSVGPMVAAKLMRGYPCKNVGDEMVAAEVPFEGRLLVIVKAEGPGGRVGKPGEAIAKLAKEYKDRLKRIITIDAAVKMEGEGTGQIAEGVGAAIGDPGPEKYKIEQVALELGIGLDAIIIKQSFEEALTTMRKEIAEAVDKAIEVVKRIVREKVAEGGVAIIAGIGNTIGVGNG
ncbi:MAG: DUF1512 domain-containing protein [Candidatus Nezhaarchaeales archaeon]|nr:MAG: DUF1512 domain-containing protein [Candidatus Nezhaarchaeota archaeon WYZ-LMO8]TDA36976.1 MAG: DUF1512 domain-containing protein [Candidatus Nezhaarchaeota archaeon WYZ-LMO7]